jgi:molecular chaperone IbpA
MRTNLDFSPFFRSSVGFDRMFDLLEDASRLASANSVAYDIVKLEEGYRITLAVPGFSQENLEISQDGNALVVRGNVGDGNVQGDILHQGIRTRSFTQRFELADYVNVTGASLSDGMLSLDLEREVPEAMKPRRIPIGQSSGREPQREIEEITQVA